MKARPAPRVQIRACSRLCLALPVGASERVSGLVVALVALQALVTAGGVRLQVLLEFVGLAPAETTALMLRSLADVGRHARRGTRVALSPPLEQQRSPGGTMAVPRWNLRRVRRMFLRRNVQRATMPGGMSVARAETA